MKKLSIVSLSLFLMIFVFSCDKQNEVADLNSKLEFIDVTIPDTYKPDLKSTFKEEILEDSITVLNKEGKEVKGKLRITLPKTDGCETDGCKITKLEITKNILQETGKTTNFLVEYANNPNLKSTHNVAECFGDCDGRNHEGWCKFWCVVEILR